VLSLASEASGTLDARRRAEVQRLIRRDHDFNEQRGRR
jgi:hypothetical protein